MMIRLLEQPALGRCIDNFVGKYGRIHVYSDPGDIFSKIVIDQSGQSWRTDMSSADIRAKF